MVRKSFLLRIDERTHQELRQWASDELRSLNAQIEYLLREAVKRRRGPGRIPRDEPRQEGQQERPR
jgi:hypothetical protein